MITGPVRIRKFDEDVWEALMGGQYYYFEAPQSTPYSRLWELAIDAYIKYVQE